ncbi:MAG TPA: NUDIX domain-containing protein [Pyrinomonadaceae bacterium]|jgi:8-oxo-dGTP pyrophosphatase MutT (NUDIX family)|nr:NUDIX domain-containing protein [Pyrinomonadaceae bacterium]
MSESDYIKNIRKKIGNDLLLSPGVAAIIRDAQGRILFQKTKQGIWSLPAGAIDPGEKPAQAIVREIFEETGLVARPDRIIGVVGGPPDQHVEYPNGDVVESTTVVFACEVIAGELKPQDDESSRLEYFTTDEMPELATPYPPAFFTEPTTAGFFEWDDSWLANVR